MSIQQLIRPHLLNLRPYSSARDEYTGAEGTFLDANENPNDFEGSWNRYPDPYQKQLKAVISNLKEIQPKHIFLGLGSDEPIDLLIRAFCEPGKDSVMILPPTYGMYKVSAGIHNIGIQEVLLTEDYQVDVERVLSGVTSTTKILFLCTPNNPTGNLLRREDVLEILNRFQGLVVIDEAYIDFHSEPSYSELLDRYKRLVVLQTLSKAWGLASIRLGMAFASPEVVGLLNKIKPPYNIPGPVQQLAFEVLSRKQDAMRTEVDEILAERKRMIPVLEQLPFVTEVIPSAANFLLTRFVDSKSVFDYLMDRKIIVRDRSSQPRCEHCLRLTVGQREENDRLMIALDHFARPGDQP